MADSKKYSILRRRQVERRTGLPRSSIYLMMAEGRFPKPIKLGPRAVGWIECEVERWLVARIKDRDSIKEPFEKPSDFVSSQSTRWSTSKQGLRDGES